MRDGYTIENECYAYEGFFKCVKVYNYHSINEVVNAISGTFDEFGALKAIGVWKIKQLKQK